VRNDTGDAQDDLGADRLDGRSLDPVLPDLPPQPERLQLDLARSDGCDIARAAGAWPSFWKPFFIIWPLGLVVLGIVWLVVRPKRVVVLNAPASSVPQAWYDDPERPGHKRWWDGATWGVRDDEHPSAVGLPTAPSG
jgi:hypothetical protein